MKVATREVFDRNDPNPPRRLYGMRNRGHWRFWNNNIGNRFVPSDALKLAEPYINYERVLIDAGCGHSPDAGMAIRHLGFREAIKVDLWPMYPDGGVESWLQEWRRFEGRKVDFIQGDVCKLSDFIDIECADLIISNAMIDLMCADDRLLFYNEASDILAPYGILSISRVPLALGHQDWVHGRDEWERIVEVGYADFECIVCRQNALVLCKRSVPEKAPS